VAANMTETQYIEHKYIKPKTIEARIYQQTILAEVVEQNTLVVLPTGLGKTIIMALLIANRMIEQPRSFMLVMAPTKPLVEQHVQTFRKVFNIIEEEIVLLSGHVRPKKREELWKQAQIVVATPQVVENDLIAQRVNLERCSFLGVDEAHRAVGDYAYTYVAKKYRQIAKHPLILGITASPGSDKQKIQEVCQNLGIEKIETRTDSSADVKPYVHEKEVEWIHLDLPKNFQRIKTLLERSLKSKLQQLKEFGWLDSASVKVNRRDLIKLPPIISKQFDKVDDHQPLYQALGFVGSSIRLTHAIELLETQGISPLLKYLDKIKKEAQTKKASRNLKRLLEEPALISAYDIAHRIAKKGEEHPKIPKLVEIVGSTIKESPDSRILVFAHYRSSAKRLAEILDDIPEIKASRFVGQASKKDDKGFSQKKQLETMSQFRDGEYNCLVATSVGEEGLDVSECDLVVFYDCVPSAVRSIQRRGRTGRKRAGRVVVLITKGTRDEGYFWASKYKERKMKQNLRELKKLNNAKDKHQKHIEDFFRAENETQEDSPKKQKEELPFDDLSVIPEETLEQLEKEFANGEEKYLEQLSEEEKTAKLSFDDLDNEETKENEIRIIIDVRESNSKIAKHLSEEQIEVQLEQLSVADYIVSSRVGIERKDVADFSQSIIDGRLFPQLIALKRSYQKPVLMLEGETLYGHRALNPEALRGAIASIILNLEIDVIWTRSTRDSARFLKTLARREQKAKNREPIIRSEKAPVETTELQEYIVAGFPNINRVLAQRILQEFGSLEAFFLASEKDLRKVKGIGAKIAADIKLLLKKKYKG
jgi:Fanconi anemia group M protein